MSSSARPPFHLAIPVHDIEAARRFYGEVLGFGRGRSDTRWTDWNVEGHQVVTHQVDDHRNAVAGTNPVDGHEVPVPHFGLVLDVGRFQDLAQRLTDAGTDFVIEPYVRFEGEPGELDDVLARPVRQRSGVQGLPRSRAAVRRLRVSTGSTTEGLGQLFAV